MTEYCGYRIVETVKGVPFPLAVYTRHGSYIGGAWDLHDAKGLVDTHISR